MNFVLDLIVFGLFVAGLAQGARRQRTLLLARKNSEHRRLRDVGVGNGRDPSW